MSEPDVKPRQPPDADADDELREYSSSPCYLHEFEPAPTVVDRKKHLAAPAADPADAAASQKPRRS